MPIQYRCPECQQLLSISTRKAGQEMPCPTCQTVSIVPEPEVDPEAEAASEFQATDDLEQPPLEQPETAQRRPGALPNWREMLAGRPAEPVADKVPDSVDESEEETGEQADETEPTDEDPLLDLSEPEATAPPDDEPAEASEPVPVDNDETAAERVEDAGFTPRRAALSEEDLDLTSMVDVTFLLLIFFMITASFSLQKTIAVPPPQPDQKGAAQVLTLEDLQDNTIFVRIDERNRLFIDDEAVPAAEHLVELLQRARLTTLRNEVAVDPHPDSLHEALVQVIDAATAAEMQKVRIISHAGVE